MDARGFFSNLFRLTPASFICVISPPICFFHFLSFFFIFVSSSLPLCFLRFLSYLLDAFPINSSTTPNLFTLICVNASSVWMNSCFNSSTTHNLLPLFSLFCFLYLLSFFFINANERKQILYEEERKQIEEAK